MDKMDKKQRAVLTIVLLSYFVTAIDGSIVITGLTKIAADLRLSQSALSWVQNAYVLTWGGFMLPGGRLSDKFGRKRVLDVSLLLFGLGSLMAGVAQTASLMIAARFVQGMAAAILSPTALALIVDYFQAEKRVKVIAWYSSISGIGLCFGLIIGGALASFHSWRDGFLLNIPLVAFMLHASYRHLDRRATAKGRFDAAGTAVFVTSAFCLVYAINGADHAVPWLCPAVGLLLLFVGIERRVSFPVLPLRLLHDRGRNRANVARTLFTGSMMGYYFFMSEYMQDVLGYSPLQTGAGFIPLTLSTFIAATGVPSAVRRWGNKAVLFGGLTLMSAGFLAAFGLKSGSSYLLGLALPMTLLGFGQGYTMSPLTNLGIRGALPEDTGAASGLVNTAHQIGCSLGLSVMINLSAGGRDLPAMCHTATGCGLVFILLAFATVFVGRSSFARVSILLCKNQS